MKRVLNLITIIVLLVTTFLISGCLPPDYTKEKAEKIVKDHQHEALAWFQQNMPDAKPDSDCKAYEMSTDLLGAVKGKYKRNGKSYDYVYEYTNKKMYIGEGYEEACKIVGENVLKDFGYNKQETEISFHGYQFLGKNENDNPRGNFQDKKNNAKEFYSYQEKLRPADKTPEQFAKSILDPNTKEKFAFYIHLYRKDFPVPQQEKQKRYKNLGSVWCNIAIDPVKQPKGIHQKIYLRDRIENRYYHLEKIDDDLFAGYMLYKGEPKSDKMSFSYQKGKQLSLNVPQGAKTLIFSKKALTLVHTFKNSKGDLIENVAEEMYKSTGDRIKGYHMYSTDLLVKDDFPYGYTDKYVTFRGGVYNYKIYGIFDLAYWRLKLFD